MSWCHKCHSGYFCNCGRDERPLFEFKVEKPTVPVFNFELPKLTYCGKLGCPGHRDAFSSCPSLPFYMRP